MDLNEHVMTDTHSHANSRELALEAIHNLFGFLSQYVMTAMIDLECQRHHVQEHDTFI